MNNDITTGLNCPVPKSDYDTIVLAHGGGGKLTHNLIENLFQKHFSNPDLDPLHDGAMITVEHGRIAFSTDSYVVSPIVFPGGTIGDLAVNGTVNDLAMCGARPQYLSASFILEEGLTMNELESIVISMAGAARKAGVHIITGDTKVVPRGKGDKMFITTAGIGSIPPERDIRISNIAVGDVIMISGTIADHGMAVMSVREGLEFDAAISSDTCPLGGLVDAMYGASRDIHFLRDPTRGGVASTLNEIAMTAHVGIRIREQHIPVRDNVRSICELLGFDPLYVANEGKLIAVVAKDEAEKVLQAMKDHPYGYQSSVIGEIVERHPGVVVLQTAIGGERVVDMISGEQLPRIC